MKASNEKSIRCIGTYFLVLGFICALLAPMFYSKKKIGTVLLMYNGLITNSNHCYEKKNNYYRDIVLSINDDSHYSRFDTPI